MSHSARQADLKHFRRERAEQSCGLTDSISQPAIPSLKKRGAAAEESSFAQRNTLRVFCCSTQHENAAPQTQAGDIHSSPMRIKVILSKMSHFKVKWGWAGRESRAAKFVSCYTVHLHLLFPVIHLHCHSGNFPNFFNPRNAAAPLSSELQGKKTTLNIHCCRTAGFSIPERSWNS